VPPAAPANAQEDISSEWFLEETAEEETDRKLKAMMAETGTAPVKPAGRCQYCFKVHPVAEKCTFQAWVSHRSDVALVSGAEGVVWYRCGHRIPENKSDPQGLEYRWTWAELASLNIKKKVKPVELCGSCHKMLHLRFATSPGIARHHPQSLLLLFFLSGY
jgi:hypothetical protein